MAILGPYTLYTRVRVGNHSTGTGAAFTNPAGSATDPTEVTLRLEKPTGTIVTYRWPTPGAGESALTKEATGRFYADYAWDVAGLWNVELRGTGAIESMAQWQVFVSEALV